MGFQLPPETQLTEAGKKKTRKTNEEQASK
jgi:hypothetical protein